MKIVLLEDVKALGKKGEVVETSEGYARNFLIPKKKGVEANAANLNTLKLLAEKLEASSIHVSIKAGKDGKTFGSISTKEIHQAIHDQLNLEVDKKKIVVPEPIKTFGTHEVTIKLHKDVAAKFAVKVVEE